MNDKNKIKEAVMKHVSIDQELQVANVFGVHFAPVNQDPSREWLVLPDEAMDNNLNQANLIFEEGGFKSAEEFLTFSNALISAIQRNGELDDVVERFEEHLSKIVSGESYGSQVH